MPAQRHCLHCGMTVTSAAFDLDELPPTLCCPKCDQDMYQQSDGSCLTVDIAHGRESRALALSKLDALLLAGWEGYCRDLRVIVGGGVIRDDVLGQLQYYRDTGRLLEYREEGPNGGAIRVRLRRV